MKITVFTTTSCRQCIMTKNWLDGREIPFEQVDAASDPKTADAIRSIAEADGVLPNMPLVQVSYGDPETDLHWFGFQPDNLKRYALEEAAA